MKQKELYHQLELPSRSAKPRETGVTMVIDNGLGPTRVKTLLEESLEYIDYVKLGWCTSLVTPNLEEKIKLYQDAGVPVCIGGTFFEMAHLKGKMEVFLDWVRSLHIDHVEVSDGSIDIDERVKLSYIEKFSSEFTVLSEYGSKDADVVYAPSRWVRNMVREIEAGAWKVIAEGRESGTAGMYRTSSELRSGLVDEIVETIESAKLLWEAPQKNQQAWFVRRFGAEVNLGNIAPQDVIPLETLRLGIRGDTLPHFHLR